MWGVMALYRHTSWRGVNKCAQAGRTCSLLALPVHVKQPRPLGGAVRACGRRALWLGAFCVVWQLSWRRLFSGCSSAATRTWQIQSWARAGALSQRLRSASSPAAAWGSVPRVTGVSARRAVTPGGWQPPPGSCRLQGQVGAHPHATPGPAARSTARRHGRDASSSTRPGTLTHPPSTARRHRNAALIRAWGERV